MRVTWLFTKWLFAKMFQGVFRKNREYRYFLENETGLALVLWIIVSLLSSIAFMTLCLGFQSVTGIDVPKEVLFAYMWACVVYLFYTGFSILYRNFKEERAQLFETIKNGN